MRKVGKSGGIINIKNILNPEKSDSVQILKFASLRFTESSKLGLQSLYAHPEDVLEQYKDFDIIKEMKARKGVRLLWVRARAIDADVMNTNGDLFSKEEILREIEYKGKKVPVYKTFEGAPVFSNHQNKDIELARGMVVYAEWCEEENAVYCTFFIDEDAYPDVAHGIRTGVIHDVSMGAKVDEGECSHCKHIAVVESDWCICQRKYKGRKHPETGKVVYEINRGVNFIELSCVNDGAFEKCEIKSLYDPDDILEYADNLNIKAASVMANISVASMIDSGNVQSRNAIEDCLREATATTRTILKFAQEAGTLVGGQLLALDNASQNATVTNILKYLGIDPGSGLNVLDMCNLALNFLEVAVMALFSKKDNIDLGHVGKVTKVMADLQSSMQDLIDDGLTNVGPQNTSPPPTGIPQPSVGTLNVQPQQQVQSNSFGGGVQEQKFAGKTKNVLIKFANFVDLIKQETENQINNNSDSEENLINSHENIKMNNYEISDSKYKIIVSQNGLVKAYINNDLQSYSPHVTEQDYNLIKSGNITIAAENLLNRFVKIASKEDEEYPMAKRIYDMPKNEKNQAMELKLMKDHIYEESTPDETLEARTDTRRHKNTQPTELALDKDSWTSRKGIMNKSTEEKLNNILPRGEDNRVTEERLKDQRLYRSKNVSAVVNKVIRALAQAAVDSGVTPNEVIDSSASLANNTTDAPDILTKAKMVKDNGDELPVENDTDMSVVDHLSNAIDDETTGADIHKALSATLQNLDLAFKSIENLITELVDKVTPMPKIDDETVSPGDEVQANLAISADKDAPSPSTEDTQAVLSSAANTADALGVSPEHVVDTASELDPDDLHKNIEFAKTNTASSIRKNNMNRIAYYGFNKKASKKDIITIFTGNLAEYSLNRNLRSKNLATVTAALKLNPQTSYRLASYALDEKRKITSAVHMRDESTTVKEINLSISDLGGAKASDPNFDSVLKNKVAELLNKAGYKVDNSNLNLNRVTVNSDGSIVVQIQSTFIKTYNVDELSSENTNAYSEEDSPVANTEMPSVPEDSLDNYSSSVSTQPTEVQLRSATKKSRLMEKISQASPASLGLGTAPANTVPTPPAPSGLTTQLGNPQSSAPTDLGPSDFGASSSPMPPASSLGLPTDEMNGNPMEGGKSHADNTPGVVKPWGTGCPLCLSTDVDVASGSGKCNSCGTTLAFTYSVTATPQAAHDNYKGNLDPKHDAALGDSDTMNESPVPTPDLSGMSLPASPDLTPTGTQSGSPVLAGKKMLMNRISYTVDPNVFIEANVKQSSKLYAPGKVCPVCFSEKVLKDKQSVACKQCRTLFVTSSVQNSDKPELVDCSITWIGGFAK